MGDIEVDGHKLHLHPERVAEWKEKGDCYPIYVEIGPSDRCNHKCIYCALDWVKGGGIDIDRDVMLNTLEEIASCGVKSVMFSGEGEPLIHKDICDFVRTAYELGLKVSITTNGVLFSKEKAEKCFPYLSWIRFSVDAGTRENYAKIHKTKEKDFDIVIENIRHAVGIKKENNYNVNISAQTLLIPDTIGEAEKLTQIIKNTGADNIQIKPYSKHPESINEFIVDYTNLKGLKKKVEKFMDKNFQVIYREETIERLRRKRGYKECNGIYFFALIDARGNILPCNLFYDKPEFSYGNLHKKGFKEIWDGEKRKEVLEKLRKRDIELCREVCRVDAHNQWLNRIKNPSPFDYFI